MKNETKTRWSIIRLSVVDGNIYPTVEIFEFKVDLNRKILELGIIPNKRDACAGHGALQTSEGEMVFIIQGAPRIMVQKEPKYRLF